MRKLLQLWEGMASWLFPPKCPFCQRVQERVCVCPVCEKSLPWEANPLQPIGKLPCAASLSYEGWVRESLHRFKFQYGRYLAQPMGRVMAQTVAEAYPDGFDVVSWAPVSKERLHERGYDQSYLLAKEMCKLWDGVPQRMLYKHTHTAAQSSLQDQAARRGNVLGVYELCPGVDVVGKRVLLVDDIITTGSTVGECARVLETAGAKEVMVIALAKTHAIV